MISQTAEYALRAIVYLADQAGVPQTTMQIAKTTQVPSGYLAKVMQNLCRAGLVNSQRGLNGGFMLARDPAELTILSVVDAVDPIRRYPECPLGIESHGRQLCPLHYRLDQAAQMVETAFRDTTVAELLAAPPQRKPLCRFPAMSSAVPRSPTALTADIPSETPATFGCGHHK
jgi:Rrf2 family transcriptional regulator, nitric oxide-sensitive transcriptional repressor